MSHIFAPIVNYTVGIEPYGVAVADVNGDGRPDIMNTNLGVSDTSAGSVSVLLNLGGGKFASAVYYSVGVYPAGVAVGDINGDEKLDIVNTNFVSKTIPGTVSVLMNFGNGTFASAAYYNVGINPSGVAIADVNGDSKLDIVSTDSGVVGNGGGVSVLLNQGNGIFAEAVTYNSGTYPFGIYYGTAPFGIAISDINDDDNQDIICTNGPIGSGSVPNSVFVLMNLGDGTFASAIYYSVGIYPQEIAAADVNGDSKPDIVASNHNSNTISVLLNLGRGNFATAVNYNIGSSPLGVAIADINSDSKPDIIVANQNSASISMLLNLGNGIFAQAINYSAGIEPCAIAIDDINGDNKPDVIITNYVYSGTVSVLLNIHSTSTSTHTYTSTPSTSDWPTTPQSILSPVPVSLPISAPVAVPVAHPSPLTSSIPLMISPIAQTNAGFATAAVSFVASTATPSSQVNPIATGLSNGGFVVLWQSYPDIKLHGQVFLSTGSKIGTEFSMTTDFDYANPVVASLENGSFVVVWQSDDQDINGESVCYSVYGQILSSSGIKLGGEFAIGKCTGFGLDDTNPQVATLANGNFVIVWTGKNQANIQDAIYMSTYSSSGSLVSGPSLVSTPPQTESAHYFSFTYPDVAALSNGGFVVVWNNGNAVTTDMAINAQVYHSDATTSGNVITAFSIDADSTSTVTATVIGLFNGNFIIADNDGSATVYQPDGTHVQSMSSSAGSSHSFALLRDGNIVTSAAYSLYTLSAQVYDQALNQVGGRFLVNTSYEQVGYVNSEDNSAVAALSEGSFIVAYESNALSPAYTSISVNLYTFLGDTSAFPVPVPFIVPPSSQISPNMNDTLGSNANNVNDNVANFFMAHLYAFIGGIGGGIVCLGVTITSVLCGRSIYAKHTAKVDSSNSVVAEPEGGTELHQIHDIVGPDIPRSTHYAHLQNVQKDPLPQNPLSPFSLDGFGGGSAAGGGAGAMPLLVDAGPAPQLPQVPPLPSMPSSSSYTHADISLPPPGNISIFGEIEGADEEV